MLKFLRKIRKGFRTACLTAALTTCWGIGQVAKAAIDPPPNWGDEIKIQFSGNVSPSISNISHLFLIYQTGASSWAYNNVIKLGDFTAGQTTFFSVLGKGYYRHEFSWYVAGLYGDVSSGQYIEGINGVVLGMDIQEGDSWAFQYLNEIDVFNGLLNDNPSNIQNYEYYYPSYYYVDSYFEISESSGLFNFSNATNNGSIQFNSEVVPEPISIILLGGGGIFVIAFRRQKK